MAGWIKIHRTITDNWVWQNSDYLKWWLDILIEVNHTLSKTLIKGSLYECPRGQKLYSLDTWAKRWGTNKSKARRFLKMLEKDNMIVFKSETQTTRITVCKYDSYQSFEDESETQVKRKRNANETAVKPIQECKEEIKNEKNENIEIYPTFNDFWDLYDKKKSKPKAELKWSKLKQNQKELIIDYLPNYINATPDKQFRKDPVTFLNNESWNDELIINNKNQKDEQKNRLTSIARALTNDESSTKRIAQNSNLTPYKT